MTARAAALPVTPEHPASFGGPAQRDDLQGRFSQAREIGPRMAAAANEWRITDATALLREYATTFNSAACALNQMMLARAIPNTSTGELAWARIRR